MKTAEKSRAKCGCEIEVRAEWDGRKTRPEEWPYPGLAAEAETLLTAEERERFGYRPAADGGAWLNREGMARLQARARYAGELCPACRQAQLDKAAGGLFTPALDLQPTAVRAAARVARLTGGRWSRSPKSGSMYVTWAEGAWRVSDHPWPGCPDSLIREHRAGRWFVARLRADWLSREKAGKEAAA